MKNVIEERKICKICDQKLIFFGPKDNYCYFICKDCLSIQLNPMPLADELEKLYKESYMKENAREVITSTEDWYKESYTYNIAILNSIKQFTSLNTNDLILDFGAGYGYLADLLNKNGFNCIGLELSKERLQYCAMNNKTNIEKGGIKDLTRYKNKISVIVMCAVFEHLSNQEEFMEIVVSTLKQNGYFITLHPTSKIYELISKVIRFGNTKKELPYLQGAFAPPWHVAFISIKGMKILAKKTDFEIVKILPAPQGRMKGLTGLIQIILETTNKIGWFFFKEKWPLVTSHIFVMKKIN
ncbi:MAG: hypothetical protein A3B68_04350 [Candidatus Melainabacteria bacterium RIFCSPHIGHO2_02_FULL_34_12]|nr:MAG: hypothetical protein A3B68_04350 [Candidatus Melainabacteria bacterium RIFCSPHIGHO2_02_FULL_34_12]